MGSIFKTINLHTSNCSHFKCALCNVLCTIIKSQTQSKLLNLMLKLYKILKEKIKLEKATILLLITMKILELQNPKRISGKDVLASFSPDQKFLEPSLQEHNADHLHLLQRVYFCI